MAPLFEKRGIDFHVEYVRSVRNWSAALPSFSQLFGAYRRRSIEDETVAPHSFTFIRRDSAWARLSQLLLAS